MYAAIAIVLVLALGRLLYVERRVRALVSRLGMAKQRIAVLEAATRAWPQAESPSMAQLCVLVDSEHPGWRDLVCQPRFKRWLECQTHELQGWASSMNPSKAIALLYRFKADRARGWA